MQMRQGLLEKNRLFEFAWTDVQKILSVFRRISEIRTIVPLVNSNKATG